MRFASKGVRARKQSATRRIGADEKTYRAKTDGAARSERQPALAWAIIETKEGIANVRDIAQVKGLERRHHWRRNARRRSARLTPKAVACVTMRRGSGDSDDPGRVQGIQEAGYPAYETDIEARMKQGFDVFIIQTFSERGFKAGNRTASFGKRQREEIT